ncbi:MAG: peptidylprolyl isomerase [Bacteroidota bacterium]|nr:peptidylprolyl isomerase [Bacteroidota bacterium]
MMAVQSGNTIKIHYHGRLSDGTTFDTSEGRSPLEFTVGSGSVIKGFDDGVQGMSVGEKKTIEIPFEQAYGPEDPSMIVEFPIDRLPQELEPEIGMQLNMNNEEGQQFPVVITDITEENIVLNANHPLAGKDLIFDLELVEILD